MEAIGTLEERLNIEALKRKESRDLRTAKFFETKRLERKEVERLGYEARLLEERRYELQLEKARRNYTPDYMGLYFDFFA